ncbi:hypothetical protein POX_f07908 [Penicillium oxalicum]|uniref:SPT2 chromatin protein n=1 Tax=Penicillium oxalicum (strain 114-2 / CGMCC 5302) TaxID=933388 RepID=S8B319_PENO1|nr:hypothetical protein POX_f07908 [Penicillium oxalicum]EPS28832.1 hypothetical protein PDE_03778 [Penicillium oxalicum 114-2]KAI2787539.1 hypothetical protein POX_f07908 [Penicillium oxalicum]
MSFLDSVLTSLETGKPVPLSAPSTAPSTSVPAQRDNRRVAGTQMSQVTSSSSSGIKRKADDQLSRPSKPVNPPPNKILPSLPGASSTTPKPNTSISNTNSVNNGPTPRVIARSNTATSSSGTSMKTAPAKPTIAKPVVAKPPVSKPTPATAAAPKPTVAKVAPTSSKPPPKGSFAALMQQAKAIQDKVPAQIGTLRHQKVQKERLSKLERKRRLEEAKAQAKAARSGKRAAPAASSSSAAVKRRTPEPLSYKGTAKPAQTPEPSTYRGTAGRQSQRSSAERRPAKRRMDEYLATDEEDEGDYGGYGEYDDYYSDASSDMEAGFDDVREEEDAALKYARKEDEEEMRMEMLAKKAKMERQKKLEALASRNRR